MYLRALTKHSSNLLAVPVALGLLALSMLAMQVVEVSLNGGVCNASTRGVWLTVTESGRQKAYLLPPGKCTDLLTQDAESIWGRDCTTDPCRYQAWKVGAGRFRVRDGGQSGQGIVLRIEGWGAGSRWHVSRAWPRPDLAGMDYSLGR